MVDSLDVTTALLLIAAGLAAGFLNTVASSGTAVTLPVMIGLGLHPMIANATNRVPVLLGCVVAVWKFHQAGQMPWKPALKLSVPLLLGAVVGLIAAENLSDMRTIRVTVFALGIAALLVVLNPSKWLSADIAEPDRAPGPLITVAVFAVGAWAGLIVLDSATYMLAVLVLMAHFPLREANAIKVFALGLVALLGVIVFTVKDRSIGSGRYHSRWGRSSDREWAPWCRWGPMPAGGCTRCCLLSWPERPSGWDSSFCDQKVARVQPNAIAMFC